MTRAASGSMLVVVSLAAAALAGCTVPIDLPGKDVCYADRAMGYIGQPYTPRVGRIVKTRTSATYLRAIAPDTAVTMEFRANRINVALDEKQRVTRIYCG